MSEQPETPGSVIVFDIETAAMPADLLADKIPAFDPADVKTGNLKDPALISAKVEQAKAKHLADFFEKAALSPATGSVVAIGTFILTTGEAEEYQGHFSCDLAGGEKELIQAFWDLYRKFYGQRVAFVGHNILDFDLPYLVNRSRILGITIPPRLFSYKAGRIYWNEVFVDTRSLWLMGRKPSDTASSLDHCAGAFGLGKKTGNGADFARLLIEDRNAAEGYLRQDLSLTFKLAQRLGCF